MGDVLVAPEPVTTVYEKPWERVLFCPGRDANPFFHLFESMWMLAGSSDARWLDTWVHDFSARFAEPSGFMHGAYGQRWRRNFLVRTHEGYQTWDQIRAVVSLLQADPTTRQAVLTMWSPERDLCMSSVRDRPCNTHVYFRPREIVGGGHRLDMTVLCRSNDIVWGAYGANAVHLSVLHEYIAALAGMRQGTMHQVSNNWHGYTEVVDRILRRGVGDSDHYSIGEVFAEPLFLPDSVDAVWDELIVWMDHPTSYLSAKNQQLFDHLLVPMARVHEAFVSGEWQVITALTESIRPTDWRRAASEWVCRRALRKIQREKKRDSVLVLPPEGEHLRRDVVGAEAGDASQDGAPEREGATVETGNAGVAVHDPVNGGGPA